jgi:hypothetical protein
MGIELWWNDATHGKAEILAGKTSSVPLFPPKMAHGRTLDRTPAAAVRGRRLTT